MSRLHWPAGLFASPDTGGGAGDGGTTTPPPSTGGDPGSSAGGGGVGTGTPPANGGQGSGAFTQADVDRIVRERLAEEQTRQKKKADEERAKAQGEWEKLATEREQRIQELEAQNRAKDLQMLRARIAAEHQLPAELADRLRGEDEASLKKDAESLAKLIPAGAAGAGNAGSPANPAGGRGATLTLDAIKQMTPEQINANWDKVQAAMATAR